MITAGPTKFKMKFFDRNVIRKRWGKINEGPLKRAGLHIRRIARNSIKRRNPGGRPSPEGQPPRSRWPGSTPPFKMIFSVPNFFGTSVTVGMVGFKTSKNPVPGLHEHGGTIPLMVRQRKEQERSRKGRNLRQEFTGPRVRRMVRFPKRSFMHPALMRARARLPHFWKNSIRR